MNERLRYIFNHPMRIPIAVGMLAFGAGTGLGYILGCRKHTYVMYDLEEDTDVQVEFNAQDLAEELNKLEDQHKHRYDSQNSEKVTLVEPDEDHTEHVHVSLKDIPDVEEPEKVFAINDEDWNYEEEIKNRSTEVPYVLHKDEFYADENGYTQTTLTYYQGDDIMADQEETPVYNYPLVVGPLRFGHGSGDPNVFYVRNDKRREEWEVVLDPGLFSVEVLGLNIENNERVRDIKHSRVGKFKLE